jgi:hypothetical protein
MALKQIAFGDSFAGMLIDGVEETPFVVATLTYNENRGIRIEVPYIHHFNAEQFKSADKWFDARIPPTNLLFVAKDCNISLFGCNYSGHSMNFGHGFSMGIIAPDEIVLKDRDGDLSDDLTFEQCKSEVDGLYEWTPMRAVKHESTLDENRRIKKVTVTAESDEGLSWDQGDAKMALIVDWATSNTEAGKFQIFERVNLVSRFLDPRQFGDHLAEQRKILSLLTLLFGRGVRFRRHRVQDSRFTEKTLNGTVVGRESFYDLISRRTVRDFSQPKPTEKELGRPIADMAQVGVEGLIRWNEHYESWRRVIEPTVSALSLPGAVLENTVVNASMSLEAAGNLLGYFSGEEVTRNSSRPTMATFAFRALASLNLDWCDISASAVGLARAIANNYNTIKHYDRGQFPDAAQTYVISRVATMIVRLLAVNLIDPSGQLIREYADISLFTELKTTFKQLELYIEDTGDFVKYPSGG